MGGQRAHTETAHLLADMRGMRGKTGGIVITIQLRYAGHYLFIIFFLFELNANQVFLLLILLVSLV